jgi:hypothetical protein
MTWRDLHELSATLALLLALLVLVIRWTAIARRSLSYAADIGAVNRSFVDRFDVTNCCAKRMELNHTNWLTHALCNSYFSHRGAVPCANPPRQVLTLGTRTHSRPFVESEFELW